MTVKDLHICPRCKGRGSLINHGGRVAFGIFTLGFGALMDMMNEPKDSLFAFDCPACDGTGRISLRKSEAS